MPKSKKVKMERCPFCGVRPDPGDNSYFSDVSGVHPDTYWVFWHHCEPRDADHLSCCIDVYGVSKEDCIKNWNNQVGFKKRSRKPPKPDVDPVDDYFGAVCNCAVRYSLGRQTYMPGLVQDFLRPLLPKLSEKTLAVMERDIRQADNYGHPEIDRPGWMHFLSELRRVMNDRGVNTIY